MGSSGSNLWLSTLWLCLVAVSAAHGATNGHPGRLLDVPSAAGAGSRAHSSAEVRIPAGVLGTGEGRVREAWFDESSLPQSRAVAARKVALEVGLHQAGGPARALIATSQGRGDLAAALLAVKLAPNLPLAHVSLGSVYWRDGDWLAAMGALADAAVAVPANLEATLWLSDTLLVLLVGVLLFGSLSFIVLVGLRFSGAAAHDLGDLVSTKMPPFARAALLGAVVLSPFGMGEGLLGSVIVLFGIAFLYGQARHRTMLALGAALLLLAMTPLGRLSGRILAMPMADPVASAALAVRQGVQDPGDIGVLRRAESGDLLAAKALAANASQRGDRDGAFERYQALAARAPTDPVVANNLANRHFRSGDVERAVMGYEAASRSLDSAIVSFNQSQALARSFQIERFEAVLAHAQQLAAPIVSELSQYKDPDFVADLPISLASIRSRMFRASDGSSFARALRTPIAPGRLGSGWPLPLALLALVSLVALLWGRRFEPSGSCSRCGVRVCARCDGNVQDSRTCDSCHRLFRHPEQTDPNLRGARLEELGRREQRKQRLLRMASLTFPGVGGILAERPDHSLLTLLCFGWVVCGLVLRAGAVPDPLVMGSMGPLIVGATVVGAGLTYGCLIGSSVRSVRSH